MSAGKGWLAAGVLVRVFAVALEFFPKRVCLVCPKDAWYAVSVASLLDALWRRPSHAAFKRAFGAVFAVRVAVPVGAFGAYKRAVVS